MIRGGATAAFSGFVEAVHEQLLAEHRQWLQGQERQEAVLRKLEDALSKMHEELADRESLAPAGPVH
jgi:hypothetical protein